MLIRYSHFRQKGFTLIEVMIALVINLFIFGALMFVFNKNLEHYQQTINTNRLYEQMSSAMNIISADIRRAGYWANAGNDATTGLNNNPFVAASTDISINVANNCILLSYDHDNNGAIPAISSAIDDERYGYRLNGNAIQARPPGALFDCSASNASWENMTDPTIATMTALTFTPTFTTITTGPASQGIIIRSVTITMTGQLAFDATVTKTLTQRVRIRNDKFIP